MHIGENFEVCGDLCGDFRVAGGCEHKLPSAHMLSLQKLEKVEIVGNGRGIESTADAIRSFQ